MDFKLHQFISFDLMIYHDFTGVLIISKSNLSSFS